MKKEWYICFNIVRKYEAREQACQSVVAGRSKSVSVTFSVLVKLHNVIVVSGSILEEMDTLMSDGFLVMISY
jgi:hypothetical protein